MIRRTLYVRSEGVTDDVTDEILLPITPPSPGLHSTWRAPTVVSSQGKGARGRHLGSPLCARAAFPNPRPVEHEAMSRWFQGDVIMFGSWVRWLRGSELAQSVTPTTGLEFLCIIPITSNSQRDFFHLR